VSTRANCVHEIFIDSNRPLRLATKIFRADVALLVDNCAGNVGDAPILLAQLVTIVYLDGSLWCLPIIEIVNAPDLDARAKGVKRC